LENSEANEKEETLERQPLNSNKEPEFQSIKETSPDKAAESPKNSPDQEIEDMGLQIVDEGDELETGVVWTSDIMQTTIQRAYEQEEDHLKKNLNDIMETPQEVALPGDATENTESSCRPEPDGAMVSESLVVSEIPPKNLSNVSSVLPSPIPLTMATSDPPMVTLNEFLHSFMQLQQELQQLRSRVLMQDNIISTAVVPNESMEHPDSNIPPGLYTLFA
jgi:hypothetical protein